MWQRAGRRGGKERSKRESDRETMASGEANVVENHDDAVAVELPAPQGWKKMVWSLFFFFLSLVFVLNSCSWLVSVT